MKSIYRLFALILAFALNGCSDTQLANDDANALELLELSFVLPRSEYRQMEPVILEFNIKNKSAKSLNFALPPGLRSLNDRLILKVLRTDEASEGRKGKIHDLKSRWGYKGYSMRPMVVLPPGTSCALVIHLNSLFDLSTPGKYIVDGLFALRQIGVYRVNDTLVDEPGSRIPGITFVVQKTSPADQENLEKELLKCDYAKLSKRELEAKLYHLMNLASDQTLESLVERFPRPASQEFSDAIVQSLLSLSNRESAVNTGARLAKEDLGEFRIEAIRIVAVRGRKEDANLIRERLDDPSGNVRWEAALAIQSMLGLDHKSPEWILKEAPAKNNPVLLELKKKAAGDAER